MDTNEMYFNNGKEKKGKECNGIKLSCLDILKSNSRDTKIFTNCFINCWYDKWLLVNKKMLMTIFTVRNYFTIFLQGLMVKML